MAKKQPTREELLKAFDDYKGQLYDNRKLSATALHNMQIAIYGCKCLVNDLFGHPRKKEDAAVK